MMLTKRLGAFVGKGAKDVMVDLPVFMIPRHGVGGNGSTYCRGYRVHIELGAGHEHHVLSMSHHAFLLKLF